MKYAVDIWDEWGNSCLVRENFDTFFEALRSGKKVMEEDLTGQFLGFFISDQSTGEVIATQKGGHDHFAPCSKLKQKVHYQFAKEEVSRFELMEI